MKGSNCKFIFQKDFWAGLILLLAFYSHYIIMGKNSVWYARDYAELVIHTYKVLIDNQAIFQSNDFLIDGILSSLPRGSFPSEFFLKTWLFFFLKPFQAVVLNKLLIHVIAYVSAFHFLNHFLKKEATSSFAPLSLLWASVPFWPEAGIGLAFMPTIFLIFYMLSIGGAFKAKYGFLILFYCLYSHLHLNGVFVALALFFFGVFISFKNKKINSPYWLSLAWLSMVFTAINYRLFDIYFFQREWFTPHRVEYDIYSFERYHDHILAKLVEVLFFGSDHAAFIAPFYYLVILGYLLSTLYSDNKNSLFAPLLWVFFGVNIIALIAVLATYRPLVGRMPIILAINEFSLDRFFYLIYPAMIFSCIFILNQMLEHQKLKIWAKPLVLIILGYQLVILDNNAKNLVLKPVLGLGLKYPTYREFFAEEQFKLINAFLDEKTLGAYKVASVGFHSSIASYNKLHSIDGYTGNYNLAYKNKFYEIIKDELGTDDRENWLYWHFKGWGNKAYLFNQTHKDDFMRMKWLAPMTISHPKFNYAKMKQLGCNYILSTDLIIDEGNLEFLGKFIHPESAWDIHIYKIR